MQASGLNQMGAVSRGRLDAAQSVKLPLELGSECLTVIAMGSDGVADLKLSLRDAEGKELVSDDMQGPDASLRFCPDQPGKHELVVLMAQGAGAYAVSTWTGGVPTRHGETSPQGSATVEGGGTCDAPTVMVSGQTYVGDTHDGRSMEEGSCGNTGANELIYRLDVPTRQRVTIDVRAQYDAVLYVRRGDCTDPDAEVACNDDAPGGGRRSRVDEVLEPGTYFVYVDGYGEEEGAFRMTLRTRPAATALNECEAAPLMSTAGTTRGTLADRVGNAKASCGNEAPGPDQPYRLDLATRSRVRIIERGVGFQPVLHVRSTCGDLSSEIACSNAGLQSGEAAYVGVLDAGSYWVYADSAQEATTGTFTLTTSTSADVGGSADGDTCGAARSLASLSGLASGDTFDARDDVAVSCGATGAADVMFRVDLLRKARLFARVRAEEGKHKLALQRRCGVTSSELECGTALDRTLEPGTYWVVVDDASPTSFGRFELGYRIDDLAATDVLCAAAPALTAGQTVSGTTTGADDNFTATCAGPVDMQAGKDRVYKFTLAKKSKVQLQLTTPAFAGVMTVRRACSDASSESGCRAASSPDATMQLEQSFDPGTYYVVIDARNADSDGEFSLQFKAQVEA